MSLVLIPHVCLMISPVLNWTLLLDKNNTLLFYNNNKMILKVSLFTCILHTAFTLIVTIVLSYFRRILSVPTTQHSRSQRACEYIPTTQQKNDLDTTCYSLSTYIYPPWPSEGDNQTCGFLAKLYFCTTYLWAIAYWYCM